MADYLTSIFGTEKDRVNCPFYFKIGACTYGDRCSRRHNKPTYSQTLLICHLFLPPEVKFHCAPEDPRVQEDYDEMYEDLYEELLRFGEIEELHLVENLSEHMIGNLYVKFVDEESAAAAIRGLLGRFYGGRAIVVEFSPVTDFREASCRQYDMNCCNRGVYCNFLHIKSISRDVLRRCRHLNRKRRRGEYDITAIRAQSDAQVEDEGSSPYQRRSTSREPEKKKDKEKERDKKEKKDRKRSRSRDRDDRHDRHERREDKKVKQEPSSSSEPISGH